MRNTPQKVPLVFTAAALLSIAALGPAWHMGGLIIVRNLTDSLPHGFYLVHPATEIKAGDLAVFRLPRDVLRRLGGRRWLRHNPILIKPVAGVERDQACHNGHTLLLNGLTVAQALVRDRDGIPMPRARGCSTLRRGWFLPISTRVPHSFDGRYFGAIPAHLLIGKALPLLTW